MTEATTKTSRLAALRARREMLNALLEETQAEINRESARETQRMYEAMIEVLRKAPLQSLPSMRLNVHLGEPVTISPKLIERGDPGCIHSYHVYNKAGRWRHKCLHCRREVYA